VPAAHRLLALIAGVALAASALRDRRIVDTVRVGDAASDAAHGYAESDVVRGMANGKPYRSARGWMRYALTTFDDTEVTLTCTFVPSDSSAAFASSTSSGRYELLVEDSLIATRTLTAPRSELSRTPVVVEVAVPFALTKGRTSIAVMIRAHDGPTPPLSELRVIQDHNEVDRNVSSQSTLPLRATR
jgi:hypothetical protein